MRLLPRASSSNGTTAAAAETAVEPENDPRLRKRDKASLVTRESDKERKIGGYIRREAKRPRERESEREREGQADAAGRDTVESGVPRSRWSTVSSRLTWLRHRDIIHRGN